MDRYEVPIDDHLAPLVEAAERGEEVVIVRDGREIARLAAVAQGPAGKLIDIGALERMQESIRALDMPPGDAAKLIREMRDEGY